MAAARDDSVSLRSTAAAFLSASAKEQLNALLVDEQGGRTAALQIRGGRTMSTSFVGRRRLPEPCGSRRFVLLDDQPMASSLCQSEIRFSAAVAQGGSLARFLVELSDHFLLQPATTLRVGNIDDVIAVEPLLLIDRCRQSHA